MRGPHDVEYLSGPEKDEADWVAERIELLPITPDDDIRAEKEEAPTRIAAL
jgi:hypothetical protein